MAPGYVRDLLNWRMANGHPSNNLTEAGLIIHTFDEHLDADEPWHTVNNLYGHGGAYSNILSCSIINDRKAGRFNGAGGVILSPASRTLCSYPYDGGAMEFEWGCRPEVCSEPNHIWDCAFPPSMLYRMMQIHESGNQWPYNEVVVDQFHMVIEAVFTGRGGDSEGIHQRLLEHFQLNENQLPLLSWSGNRLV